MTNLERAAHTLQNTKTDGSVVTAECPSDPSACRRAHHQSTLCQEPAALASKIELELSPWSQLPSGRGSRPPDKVANPMAQPRQLFTAPTIIAHRGASALAPESTRVAYELASRLGADFLEADIQRTKDGVLVVLHDRDLQRTTNVAEIYPERAGDPVSSFTWSELQRLDAGSWFDPAFAGEKVLALEHLIDVAEGGQSAPGLYLETKAPDAHPGIEAEIVAMLKRRGWVAADGTPRRRLVLESFSVPSLAELKRLAPAVPRTLLANFEAGRWHEILSRARELDCVAIAPVHVRAVPWNLERVKRGGFHAHPYTIDNGLVMRAALWSGANGFFTNRCERALEMTGRIGATRIRQIIREVVG